MSYSATQNMTPRGILSSTAPACWGPPSDPFGCVFMVVELMCPILRYAADTRVSI